MVYYRWKENSSFVTLCCDWIATLFVQLSNQKAFLWQHEATFRLWVLEKGHIFFTFSRTLIVKEGTISLSLLAKLSSCVVRTCLLFLSEIQLRILTSWWSELSIGHDSTFFEFCDEETWSGFSAGSLFLGIFAYINFCVPRRRKYILELLISGLQRLEYRGYDSAGLWLFASIFLLSVFNFKLKSMWFYSITGVAYDGLGKMRSVLHQTWFGSIAIDRYIIYACPKHSNGWPTKLINIFHFYSFTECL